MFKIIIVVPWIEVDMYWWGSSSWIVVHEEDAKVYWDEDTANVICDMIEEEYNVGCLIIE